jgi:hypothetical protein
MEIVYLKYSYIEGMVLRERQLLANVLLEKSNGVVIVSYEMDGSRIIKILDEQQYSKTPYLMEF